jgi:hypothetical protein
MLACCDTFFPAADTVPFTVFCRTFVQNAAGLTPVPANEAVAEKRSFPFGALLQPYRDGNRWRAVINGLFPCGGKLTARWLHLFPAHVREHLETFHRNQNLRVFPWHGWFNANFQPSALQAGVCMPGSRWPLRPEDTNLNQLMLRRQGTLLWVEDQPGRPLVFTDLGLEAPESKSTAVRLLYELTVPEVSVQALKGGVVWTEITEGLHHRPRLERGDLVVTREAWRVEENVWRYWIEGGKTPAEHYRHGTTALRALGVPRHFFYRFTGKKPQWVDSRHPLMVQLFEKDLRHGSGLLWLEEMLPTPGQAGARAWELVVDPI